MTFLGSEFADLVSAREMRGHLRALLRERTSLSVVALRTGTGLATHLTAETMLRAGGELITLGTRDQRRAFAEAFE